ncbi:acyltransferase domain-containing protein [Azospirillum rugosum]|uniref:[acyl-carrier-protein] S-malonyltransferase n=1 Tax=Azospirillum rugosum TaxID=416170 RepID=A0ABS4SPH3_9PROT|nr:acyltransferase domain-containing protein [Azospirillum rugosum]MBP2293290.1 [acyl-carrier-protein] S-malonyltransferase [Azospirillum rugosum]
MGIAILCSGQGAQAAGMFDLVGDAPEAAPVFAAARRVLGGRDPRDFVLQASGADLHANHVAQILCCTQALAFWSALGPASIRPIIVAGYSAGELAAWGIAGMMDVDTILELTAARAALMDAASPVASGLGAILGLPRTEVEAICRAHDLHIAIVNGPQHVLVGGAVTNLEPALADAQQRGATRTVRLPVGVASHTPLLRHASDRFADLLRRQAVETRVPVGVRLISGIDGAAVVRVEAGLRKLATQIRETVDWAACMAACVAARPQRVLELGPGDALARMIADAEPGVRARSVTDFHSLDGIRHWLAADDTRDTSP